jgi:hypothetical protein
MRNKLFPIFHVLTIFITLRRKLNIRLSNLSFKMMNITKNKKYLPLKHNYFTIIVNF